MTLEELTKLAQSKGFSSYGEAFWRFKNANPQLNPDAHNMELWLKQH